MYKLARNYDGKAVAKGMSSAGPRRLFTKREREEIYVTRGTVAE